MAISGIPDLPAIFSALAKIRTSRPVCKDTKKKKPIKEKVIFQCELCDYKSTNNNNYLTHKLNNHSDKKERKEKFSFYCDKCDFGVFTQSMIDRHN